jgi:hypothetical protein
MGKDFPAFAATHVIDFPTMPPDTPMKTRLQQPEESKIRLSATEADREVKRIQEKFRESHPDASLFKQ